MIKKLVDKKPAEKIENFNIIISGYGGQGVLTLAEIIARTGVRAGYQVRQAELHGLAQRGGALRAHIRLGQEIYSPLVRRGGADLIISLDLLETWRSCYWAGVDRTTILTNSTIFWPYSSQLPITEADETKKKIRKFAQKLKVVVADDIVEKLTGQKMAVNIFLLGLALKDGSLPLSFKETWRSIEEKVKGKFLAENRKVFDQALKD
jgi:indolepyruvate ferredoxin oxidoreductase, beta subunit